MKKLICSLIKASMFVALILIIIGNRAKAQTSAVGIDKLTGDSKKPALLQTASSNQSSDTRYERCGQIQYEKYRRANDPMFDNKRQELEKAVEKIVNEMEKKKFSTN